MAIPAALRQDLSDIPLLEDSRSLRMRSRDFFWFSPILRETLEARRQRCRGLQPSHLHSRDNAGWKRVDAPQAEFQRLADPYGLMNPGKLAHWRSHDMQAIA
jgi:hypothetical protein